MLNFITSTLASAKKPETAGTIAQNAPSVETAGSVAYSGSFNTGSSSGSSFCAIA